MSSTYRPLCLAIAVALLAACGKQGDASPAQDTSANPDSTPNTQITPGASDTRGGSDFGSLGSVTREVEGIGSTPEHAILAALQSAVSQVNGTRVNSQMQGIRSSLSLSSNGSNAGSVNADAFLQQVIAGSQGTILGYRILEQAEVQAVDEETIARVRASDAGYSYSASSSASASASGSGSYSASAGANASDGTGTAAANAQQSMSASYKQRSSAKESTNIERGASSYDSEQTHRKMRSYWKVRIAADIAQYNAPDEQGRPKIVVAMPRTLDSSYLVGDARVPADEVARAIRARLSDTLTQTKRFIVLDREFSDELQAEIEHINSGNVRLQDSARVGQQLSTDLLLIPSLERFAYPRHVRQLRMSDRKVTSYSGGGRITLRLVNATTGEVVMSDSFNHRLADTGPSTLPRVVDGSSMAQSMMDSLSKQIGTAIIAEIFPVSVVSLAGDQAVLSQGGESLAVGERWRAVKLGDELRVPQTGRSLGRHEMDCCIIRIDRVSNQTSYGTIEQGEEMVAGNFVSGSIELRERLGTAAQTTERNTSAQRNDNAGPPAARASKPPVARAAAPAVEPANEDPNW